jgi:hypothetical protein
MVPAAMVVLRMCRSPRAIADDSDLRTTLIRLTGTHWHQYAKLPHDPEGATGIDELEDEDEED